MFGFGRVQTKRMTPASRGAARTDGRAAFSYAAVIGLSVMMYTRFPLSLRIDKDLLHER